MSQDTLEHTQLLIKSLRDQLAEERQQKHDALYREQCRRTKVEADLIAARAEVEELSNAFDLLWAGTERSDWDEVAANEFDRLMLGKTRKDGE